MMMKYRRLHIDELEELEPEFITFLAANGIDAPSWEQMKREEPERSEALVDQFSDIVFEKILGKVELLERRQKSLLQLFKFHENHIEMLGLRVEGESELDFRVESSAQQMIQQLQSGNAKLQLMKAEKKYRQESTLEKFKLLEEGCLITRDDTLYESLKSLTQQKTP